ncbi:3'-5' exonuclease [Georgenia sp. TF02-10]|uniref:3'-5' exonuclease n=1 Tax=Georgenia sp. TF02-10 TaxID=2917725 RepID=UPI001FA71F1B|nr:3'-5' exonuclease [Georgenia sp. TF02-10]UNX53199.1 3'-5' exonuclease [Georgenia sp. TF02-10]
METTGFSPAKGDRVIEIAVARVDASGRIEDEYATLINPEGRDTGPVFVHGISNGAVRNAPLFADVAGDVLARLEGAVVVAHNAVFEERFLAAELSRAGISVASLPALCSLWLGQQTFDTPNHKLATLAREAGIPLVDAHAALGDVRAVGRLLPMMLDRHGAPLVYGCRPGNGMAAAHRRGATPVTRAVELRKGTDGWMASLLARLPMSTGEVDDAAAEVYLEALAEVLADGKLVGEEAKLLARAAGSAGMGAAQVAALNERFLETMRDVALADDVLTAAELRQLTKASTLLGVPDYFDDLTPTSLSAAEATRPLIEAPRGAGVPLASEPAGGDGASTVTAPGASTATIDAHTAPAKPRAVRRCGHCRQPGHYRSTCPALN